MQNLKVIQEMLGLSKSCQGIEVGETSRIPGVGFSMTQKAKAAKGNALFPPKASAFDFRNISCLMPVTDFGMHPLQLVWVVKFSLQRFMPLQHSHNVEWNTSVFFDTPPAMPPPPPPIPPHNPFPPNWQGTPPYNHLNSMHRPFVSPYLPSLPTLSTPLGISPCHSTNTIRTIG